MTTTSHCPHCAGPLPAAVAPGAMRCPTCRLIVGAGRGLTGAQATPVSAGTSAGIRANAARRADVGAVDEELVTSAILRVATEVGGSCERLRMLEYDARATQEPGGFPDLATVLATFGSWKAARSAAAQRRRHAPPPTEALKELAPAATADAGAVS